MCIFQEFTLRDIFHTGRIGVCLKLCYETFLIIVDYEYYYSLFNKR